MNTYKYLTFLTISLLLFSCKNEQTSAPENNNFSYLDSSNTHKENQTAVQSKDNQIDINNFSCQKIHTELIGDIISKNTGTAATNQPDYVKSIVLNLNSPFSLECSNHNKITATEIILNINPELNIDQYMGGTVIAIGEIGKSSKNNGNFPIEMNVIRLEVTKGSIK